MKSLLFYRKKFCLKEARTTNKFQIEDAEYLGKFMNWNLVEHYKSSKVRGPGINDIFQYLFGGRGVGNNCETQNTDIENVEVNLKNV